MVFDELYVNKKDFDLENSKKLVLDEKHIFDAHLIASRAFYPLEGFMGKENVLSVLENFRLKNGILWAIPIVLPVKEEEYYNINIGDKIFLFDENDICHGYIEVDEKFELDLTSYSKKVFGTTDENHPGIKQVLEYGNKFISGKVEMFDVLKLDEVYDGFYLKPNEFRKFIEDKNLGKVIAFQTRNPIHRAHEYLIKCSLENADAVVINPIIGKTKSDDIPAKVRMDCYKILLENYFNKEKSFVFVLPLSMNYAGPREAIHHLLVRQNYGFSNMIIGRDHAGVGDYYGTYDAQELAKKFENNLNIKPIYFEHAFFCKKCDNLATLKTCSHSRENHIHLSGTKVREKLRNGENLPKEFSRKEVANILTNWVINQ